MKVGEIWKYKKWIEKFFIKANFVSVKVEIIKVKNDVISFKFYKSGSGLIMSLDRKEFLGMFEKVYER